MLFPSAFMGLIFGVLSAYFARLRGKNPYLWFFLGMLFGVFGLAFLLFTPYSLKKSNTEERNQKTIDIPPPYDAKHNEKFWYYLDAQNTQYGPMSFEALYRLYTTATIFPHTYVWNETLEGWQHLKNFL